MVGSAPNREGEGRLPDLVGTLYVCERLCRGHDIERRQLPLDDKHLRLGNIGGVAGSGKAVTVVDPCEDEVDVVRDGMPVAMRKPSSNPIQVLVAPPYLPFQFGELDCVPASSGRNPDLPGRLIIGVTLPSSSEGHACIGNRALVSGPPESPPNPTRCHGFELRPLRYG